MIPPLDDSALALERLVLGRSETASIGDEAADRLVYVASGSGQLSLGDASAPLRAGSAGLVLAGETASLRGGEALELVIATVDSTTDLHAPMGRRDLVVSLDEADAHLATGARSFQILFGPHNGSTRATLFAGFIPPGKAPWHYHLYDEIVFVPDGPGRLHVREETVELGPRAAFRLRPRHVHIVENLADAEMTIIGVFTPAGSPSAAYLEADVAAEYRFSE